MATKHPEFCPKCSTMTFPNDRAIQYTENYVDFFVRIWKYSCAECGWVWANLKQREHNAVEHNKRRRLAHDIDSLYI